jgi:hypothetical protein
MYLANLIVRLWLRKGLSAHASKVGQHLACREARRVRAVSGDLGVSRFDPDLLYQRSRPLFQVGRREESLCLFMLPTDGRKNSKDTAPTGCMEVICDDFVCIWWCNFGSPGASYDVQIMRHSRLFGRIRTGEWPSALPNIDISSVLAVVIYGSWLLYFSQPSYGGKLMLI